MNGSARICAIGLPLAAAAAWWAAAPIARPPPLQAKAAAPDSDAALMPAPAPWWPPQAVPAAQEEATPPSLHLLTVSRRDGRWTALIEGGHGERPRRVAVGDAIDVYRVEAIDASGVTLVAGRARHVLGLSR